MSETGEREIVVDRKPEEKSPEEEKAEYERLQKERNENVTVGRAYRNAVESTINELELSSEVKQALSEKLLAANEDILAIMQSGEFFRPAAERPDAIVMDVGDTLSGESPTGKVVKASEVINKIASRLGFVPKDGDLVTVAEGAMQLQKGGLEWAAGTALLKEGMNITDVPYPDESVPFAISLVQEEPASQDFSSAYIHRR
ncbi:MAG TPA: hypothetical protein VMR41_03080 [Patescibacteria group bacterium]|nr:hypothetical protein [Patescibacteria group bacterium]